MNWDQTLDILYLWWGDFTIIIRMDVSQESQVQPEAGTEMEEAYSEILSTSFQGDFFLISRAIRLEAEQSWDSWISCRWLITRVSTDEEISKEVKPDGQSEFSDLDLFTDSRLSGDAWISVRSHQKLTTTKSSPRHGDSSNP